MRQQKTIPLYIVFGLALVYGASVLLEGCNPDKPATTKVEAETPNAFVGSEACQSCHANQFTDWKQSDHFLAMSHASDSTVLGDFNNTTHIADGVTSKFFKRDGKFFINTQGNDGRNHDYEVLYTFGHFPLQQYLVSFPGGRLQSLRVSWNTRDKKWFNQYPGQTIHHRDWLHWTGASQNWNTMCASCHSTDLQKNYNYKEDSFQTTWHEISVGCESCHGAGSSHIKLVSTPGYVNDRGSGFLDIRSTPQLQLNACAPCHARKANISAKMLNTTEIMDDLIPQIISNEFYFPDGQIRDEDYEYGSFAQSKMFHNNVKCSNCHNPHSGKIKAEGNNLCMSCHAPKYNTKEHHFHGVDTEGGQCINCHMPVKTFMGNDHRRDHSFRVPRPDQSVVYGTPNTCTSCHTGKSDTWAADAVKKWYGAKRAYHFSDDLLPGSQLTDKSEKHLIKLLRDTLQPEIARATAAYYLESIQSMPSVEALRWATSDARAMVRYYAIRALSSFPPELWHQQVEKNLSDKVRAVRIATAELYHRAGAALVSPAARSAYAKADAENKKYMEYQTDFAVGNLMLADYELQGGNHLRAIELYIRGLKKDSLANYARLNLSAAYSSVGNNQASLQILNEASVIDPRNDRIYYNLALLQYEMGNVKIAEENFKKVMHLGSQNPGAYYNYGLLLQQQGKLNDAEKVLLRGFVLEPQAANLNYALTYLYITQNQLEKAKKHAVILQRVDPANPAYQEMFTSLGL